MSWRPTGRPAGVRPAGAVVAGSPVSVANEDPEEHIFMRALVAVNLMHTLVEGDSRVGEGRLERRGQQESIELAEEALPGRAGGHTPAWPGSGTVSAGRSRRGPESARRRPLAAALSGANVLPSHHACQRRKPYRVGNDRCRTARWGSLLRGQPSASVMPALANWSITVCRMAPVSLLTGQRGSSRMKPIL